MRRFVVALLVSAAALLLATGVAGAEHAATPIVPHSIGMVPAAEAPPAPEPSPAGAILEVGGGLLLLAGLGALARSWVSPARAG